MGVNSTVKLSITKILTHCKHSETHCPVMIPGNNILFFYQVLREMFKHISI